MSVCIKTRGCYLGYGPQDHKDAMTTFDKTPVPTLSDTLAERGKRYGRFEDQARYAQGFDDVAAKSPNLANMRPSQREALRLIFNKVGRILNGDADYSDSWHDIAGYATLVDNELKAEGK